MAVPRMHQPVQVKPKLIYSVHHGVTKNRLSFPVATLAEAEEQAERLSSEAAHTVEVWRGNKLICWYFEGVKG